MRVTTEEFEDFSNRGYQAHDSLYAVYAYEKKCEEPSASELVLQYYLQGAHDLP
jgi:hypothetical protein